MADLIPLFQESAATIRTRLDSDVNAGLDIDDPERIDTREGTFYYDLTQSVVLELARVWDALGTEVPAAALPLHAWGDYLDDHAETFGLARKEASYATAVIMISGAAGLLVGQGTVFVTDPATADTDPVEFETLESLTLSASLGTPDAPTVSVNPGGSFAEGGSYYYFVSATSAYGETLPSEASAEAEVEIGDQVEVTWSAVPGAESYSVYRGDDTDPEVAVLVGTATTESFTDAGNIDLETVPQAEDQSAGGSVSVRAVEPGVAGNVAQDAIVNTADDNPDIYKVTNPDAASGGAEVESDEQLRTRVITEWSAQGAGTITDYKRWALAIDGIGRVSVEPLWDGPGTVLVIANQTDGAALQNYGTVESGNLILNLQEQLDPTRLDLGTCTISSLTVTDSTKEWAVDQWVGKSVVVGSKYAVVVSNTATELTVDGWRVILTDATTSAPSGDDYLIGTTATGSGLGRAPIGAEVTVVSATPVTVNVSATVVLKTGYTANSELVAVESALDRYFQTLEAGGDVAFRKVQSAFFEAPGIADVASLFINVPELGIVDSTADVALDGGLEAQIAKRGDVSLTVAAA